ncbi:hypothetical protein Pcinc_036168 [Petrolisthes cinctipes]|uniref:Uncharacterized protein n=1 Tax=Petrolisthes cinctipes TaxID=88211 RepID=A0AAE1BYB8_PETCI|nr:hypothetical protein Pcinc_036168 [Petrolisthes cinctipes]
MERGIHRRLDSAHLLPFSLTASQNVTFSVLLPLATLRPCSPGQLNLPKFSGMHLNVFCGGRETGTVMDDSRTQPQRRGLAKASVCVLWVERVLCGGGEGVERALCGGGEGVERVLFGGGEGVERVLCGGEGVERALCGGGEGVERVLCGGGEGVERALCRGEGVQRVLCGGEGVERALCGGEGVALCIIIGWGGVGRE